MADDITNITGFADKHLNYSYNNLTLMTLLELIYSNVCGVSIKKNCFKNH